jgi:hypothetical protein
MSLKQRLIKVGASVFSVLFAIAAVMLIVTPHSAQALPTSGAHFNVNSNADTNSQDSVLTLREALLVANSTLTGPFNDAEKDQMPDCTFSGSTNNWTITGGCLGVPDWIYFVSNYTITLTSALPVLSADGTMISAAPGQVVKINANNGSYNVFKITGNDVQIDGVRVYGSGTDFSNIWITGSAVRVRISNNTIGIDDIGTGTYGLSPNSYGGIFIDSTGGTLGGGDARVWIYGNSLCCHGKAGSEGISLVGTDNVVIGADSLGNAGFGQHNYSSNNNGNGIVIKSGAHDNFIRNSDINANVNLGVLITGNSYFNVVKESSIYRNENTGVQIDGGAYFNRIGSPLGGPTTSGNMIGGNTHEGIYISGTNTAYNGVYGNKIGVYASGTVSYPNGHNGVVLDNGTHDNYVGSTISETNVIAGNGLDGVLIANGSHDNFVKANDIGFVSYTGLTFPNFDGIGLDNALTNTIGGIGAGNIISKNSGSGIYIHNGSHNNFIGENSIAANAYYGIILDGNTTFLNFISRTVIARNGYDGIGERSNANWNVWSQVSIYNNGGLGIDKFADYGDTANIVDAPPVNIIKVVQSGSTTVDGTGPNGSLIELYQVAPDPSGFGEGKVFVGSAAVSGGLWEIIDPSGGACYTTIEIALGIVSTEFGANNCRTFLPLVLKNH